MNDVEQLQEYLGTNVLKQGRKIAKKVSATCQRSHSWLVVKPGFDVRSLVSEEVHLASALLLVLSFHVMNSARQKAVVSVWSHEILDLLIQSTPLNHKNP